VLGLLVCVACSDDDGAGAPAPGDAGRDVAAGAPDADATAGSDGGPVKPISDTGPSDVPCIDRDHDGYGRGCPRGADCDDDEPRIHADGLETCNGADDDCDGLTDEEDPHLGADCEVEAAGCRFPGTYVCYVGERQCHAGHSLVAGQLPHVERATTEGWVAAWLAPGPEAAGRYLQVFATRLDPLGSMLDAPAQLSHTVGLEPRAPRALGGGAVVYLGPPEPALLELHVMLGRLADLVTESLAPLDPVAAFPPNVRPGGAQRADGTAALAWWDGRTEPGGVRFQLPGREPVTSVGGAAAWGALAASDDGWELAFTRAGQVRLLPLQLDGQPRAAEIEIDETTDPRRTAVAAAEGSVGLAWLAGAAGGAAAKVVAAEVSGGAVLGATTLTQTGEPDLDPAVVAAGGRFLFAWTDTAEGAEILVSDHDGPAVSLGPGAGPSFAEHPDGPGLVFDRLGQVHFVQAACP